MAKRDEWTESAIRSLLQIYESKWLIRKRAKLKGTDWEEIANQVSIHNPAPNSRKTPIQCKNKIESMKKRYRAEAQNPNSISPWLFFPRMDSLLKGAFSENFDGSNGSAKGYSGARVWRKMADLMVKIEKGRMEMFRDCERVRAEAEIRKWEMEVKRAEIVSKTQLRIARLVVRRLCGKGDGEEGSGLKTELDMLSRREGMGD